MHGLLCAARVLVECCRITTGEYPEHLIDAQSCEGSSLTQDRAQRSLSLIVRSSIALWNWLRWDVSRGRCSAGLSYSHPSQSQIGPSQPQSHNKGKTLEMVCVQGLCALRRREWRVFAEHFWSAPMPRRLLVHAQTWRVYVPSPESRRPKRGSTRACRGCQ